MVNALYVDDMERKNDLNMSITSQTATTINIYEMCNKSQI